MKHCIALSCLALTLAAPSFAQTVPAQMNFQGRLAKPDGTPVADGSYNVTFSLYNAATGGTLLWQRSIPGLPARNGVIAARLNFAGNFQNGATLSSAFNGALVYLDISLNGGASLTPRQQFVSNAYAFAANTAFTVPDGSVTGAKIAGGTITADKLAAGVAFSLPYSATVSSGADLFSLTNSGGGNAATFLSSGSNGSYSESTSPNGNGIVGVANTGTSAYGVLGVSTQGQGGHFSGVSGVYGLATSGSGVYGSSNTGTAGYFTSGGTFGVSATTTKTNGTAISAQANSGASSFGVYATATQGTGGYFNGGAYGVRAGSDTGTAVYGASNSGFGGYFDGGLAYSGALTHSSDARYKTHIATLRSALDNVLALRGVSYEYRRDAFPTKNFAKGTQYGFIAQEVEAILPTLVYKDKDGYRSLDYTQVIPLLVEAVKSQEQQIEALKKEREAQNREIEALKAQAKDAAEWRRQAAELAELKKQFAAFLAAQKNR